MKKVAKRTCATIIAIIIHFSGIICMCASFWIGHVTHNTTLFYLCFFGSLPLTLLALWRAERWKKLRREEFINNPSTIATTGVVIAIRTQSIPNVYPSSHFATCRFYDTAGAVQQQETDNSIIPTIVGQKVTLAYAPGQPKTVIITSKEGLDLDILIRSRLPNRKKFKW